MQRRIVVFCAGAVVLAAVFVRLGVWQLDRLAERRAHNRETQALIERQPAPFLQLRREGAGRYRQTLVAGVPQYADEFVLTGRSRDGSPGVHIFTPVRMPGSDTVVLVNRGWVYAADAATADLARWHEPRSVFHGYTMELSADAFNATKGRGTRMLTAAAVEVLLPRGAFPLYVVSQDSMSASTPARLPAPALDEGPHMSYAIQWFCFALIALAGAAVVARRSLAESRVTSHESRL